jgi:hypothetical protein
MSLSCVSEQRPPTDLLFIPQLLYEHVESKWNDIDRGKILIHPPELCGSSTSSSVAGGAWQRK